MRTTQILMNKTVYLDLSILNLCKTAMCGFWHYYVKPKYGENAKLGCMDIDSFIVHVKREDIVKYVEKDLTLQILNQADHCLEGKI